MTLLDLGLAVLALAALGFFFERPRLAWRWYRARRATRKLDHFIRQAEQRRHSDG